MLAMPWPAMQPMRPLISWMTIMDRLHGVVQARTVAELCADPAAGRDAAGIVVRGAGDQHGGQPPDQADRRRGMSLQQEAGSSAVCDGLLAQQLHAPDRHPARPQGRDRERADQVRHHGHAAPRLPAAQPAEPGQQRRPDQHRPELNWKQARPAASLGAGCHRTLRARICPAPVDAALVSTVSVEGRRCCCEITPAVRP